MECRLNAFVLTVDGRRTNRRHLLAWLWLIALDGDLINAGSKANAGIEQFGAERALK